MPQQVAPDRLDAQGNPVVPGAPGGGAPDRLDANENPIYVQHDTSPNEMGAFGSEFVLGGAKKLIDIGADVAVGAGKKLIETGLRGGALLRKIPGVDAVANALPSVPAPDITPTNTAQRVGGMVEQMAEVAAPAKAIYSAGLKAAAVASPRLAPYLGTLASRIMPRAAVEAAGAAGLALAQGATPGQAGASAVLGAAVPTAGELAGALADSLRHGAAKNVADFFHPTKEAMKRIVGTRTDEVLDRGTEVLGTVGRNREGALETFAAARDTAGAAVDDALKTFGSDVVQDAPQRLMAALDTAKSRYVKTRIVSAAEAAGPLKPYVVGPVSNGQFQVAIPLNKAKVAQIDGLKDIVQAHGDTMSVDDLVGLRRAWDEIAYAKPNYGEIGPSQSAKWAKKMGGDAIRGIIASDKPELQEVNREFAFWADLETVMSATVDRKRGQVGGLLPSMAQQAGQVAGALSGGLGGAVLVGKAAKTAQEVFASPRYASLSAVIKTKLADALVAGNTSAADGWLRLAAVRVGVVEGPRVLVPSP